MAAVVSKKRAAESLVQQSDAMRKLVLVNRSRSDPKTQGGPTPKPRSPVQPSTPSATEGNVVNYSSSSSNELSACGNTATVSIFEWTVIQSKGQGSPSPHVEAGRMHCHATYTLPPSDVNVQTPSTHCARVPAQALLQPSAVQSDGLPMSRRGWGRHAPHPPRDHSYHAGSDISRLEASPSTMPRRKDLLPPGKRHPREAEDVDGTLCLVQSGSRLF